MDSFLLELAQLKSEGLFRRTEAWPQAGGRIELPDGRTLLNFSSNDYLGLACDPHIKHRAIQAIERWGCGGTSSRLMCGTLELHEELESALARLVGGEAALVFSSGFGMNVGVVSALAGREDLVFADRLSHASLIDGARLSGATVKRFAHNDTAALARLLETTPSRGRRVIVTESVFSMDGDLAPLEDLRALATRHEAILLVDEAHSIGIWGRGGGVCKALGETARPDFTAATLGKALGTLGGFIVSSTVGREFLVNRARSFIFATALPPACAGAALGAIERLRQDPTMGERLLERARAFHGLLLAEGLQLPEFRSQILPVHVGENTAALELAQRLREQGLLATAVRPPTVPRGTARLRLSVTLAHELSDLQWAAARIGQVAREMRLA
ncbi:7-keto-8-aminopelargonate synthetase-like enzyme [Desulfocurvibacter africanus PCS]|uniref:8-amino-7-oxononanoate synthase n=1 Tax=Desulfocurvibacter africanus PCS TaxID=1262666 RepID=M5Q2E6_DESAF|nr:8-amino-7-oxononanoate synthase [Desulfocurvibacter africanus]EMG37358.1 7-keto-8-aminopelargonate synthetase-like enzyme [Desulfocurvibacter africanus PCS]